ncbi:hypothetical protein NJB14192_01730, partial [Mycobacterium montefiorense]
GTVFALSSGLPASNRWPAGAATLVASRGPGQLIGGEIFTGQLPPQPPGTAPASRLSTTTEVRPCQYYDFAAQSPQKGQNAVTVSLLKVNSPYRSVNNCERAVFGTGFTEHGHLLSGREFGDYGGGTICRS